MADAEERGGRGGCESAGETSNINSGEILLHRRISWHPAPAWISTFTFTGFLLLHLVDFYLYISWHWAPAWISTFTFSLLNYWPSNLKTCETCYCICSKILSPFKLRVSLSLDFLFQRIVFISCWLDISKSGFWRSWSCPAKISPLNSAEDFAHINIMTVGFPSCATTIIIPHHLMKTPPKAPNTKQPSTHLEVSGNWVSSHATAIWVAMLFLGSQISIWIHLDPWIEAQFCIPAGFTSFRVPNFSSNMLLLLYSRAKYGKFACPSHFNESDNFYNSYDSFLHWKASTTPPLFYPKHCFLTYKLISWELRPVQSFFTS